MPGFKVSLRMRQLPKQEWALFTGLKEHFELLDPSELVLILTRLAYEVYHMEDAHVASGYRFILDVINTYRSNPTEVRTYDLTRYPPYI